ncbi:Protein of unknown function [Geoalkalibacter ferrihydriticus]|uniref:DUF2796 domain-containing protein n=2 Tax=Geoalkalibacter ferrihydriticus TaxID=392333 RepID=A0A0C2HT07_9BACT|nr:DUF2796 domain-containing protein [Geoalkalibacter ferrihydriticus]KIH75922.1 hypothetical protein GFER_13475 [Geoalkalibacter ferrihydriticus DSM 17813]SDM55461.1 Protein of unknown function [Geoalkalibacter ferrihydriticus]
MLRLLISLLAFTLVLPATALAHSSHGVHEHGAADLRIAVDGPILLIQIESPLDNLVGFEHRPRTDAERAALADMEEMLAQFDRLFLLPEAATCTLRDRHLQSPWPQNVSEHSHDHKHDDKHDLGHSHADITLTYELECANPQALTAVEVRWFEVFPRTERIRAETATPRGQGSSTLRKGNPRLPL